MDGITEVVYLYLDDIIPNRFQPREVFEEQSLKELAVSIKEHGVIQPIIVRQVENKYEIIAGERRYKAATMAGLTKIPAIVRNLDDKKSSKVALIENLQRRDLTPIEEARTYQKILELEGNMTQQELAATMGKTQSAVSNKLRLLSLPDEVQDALLKEKISERHARSLLNVEDKNAQIKLLDKIINERLTVRDLDKEIKEMNNVVNISNEPTVSFNNEPTVSLNTEPTVSFNNEPTLSFNNEPSVSFANNEPTVGIDNNPTAVDINQIRENAVNINPTPTVVEEQKTEESTFKFVPTVDFGELNQDNKITMPQPNEVLNNFFGGQTTNQTSSKKDAKVAVSNIKAKVTELEQSGYNFKVEESETPTHYQIIINVNKD